MENVSHVGDRISARQEVLRSQFLRSFLRLRSSVWVFDFFFSWTAFVQVAGVGFS